MNFDAIEKINQPQTEYEVEKKELDLTKFEDLDFLVSNAEDLYNDILSYELVSESDNYKSFTNKKIGREIFLDVGISLEELKLQALELKTEIANENFNITDTQVDDIQNLYNYLISVREDFKSVYHTIDDIDFITETDLVKADASKSEEADTYFFSAVSKESDEVKISRRGNLLIRNGNKDGDIKIEVKVSDQATETIAAELNQVEESPAQLVVADELSPAEQGTLAAVEKNDPINEVITEPTVTPDTETKNYIVDNSFKEIADKNNFSPETFDRYLKGLVERIEYSTLDYFDKIFGEFDSAFAYVKDLSLVGFQNLLNEKDLINIIRNENIKYETFLVWADMLNEKVFLLEDDEDESKITFEEFFGRWAIEQQTK